MANRQVEIGQKRQTDAAVVNYVLRVVELLVQHEFGHQAKIFYADTVLAEVLAGNGAFATILKPNNRYAQADVQAVVQAYVIVDISHQLARDDEVQHSA